MDLLDQKVVNGEGSKFEEKHSSKHRKDSLMFELELFNLTGTPWPFDDCLLASIGQSSNNHVQLTGAVQNLPLC